jgi:hypothetical protein
METATATAMATATPVATPVATVVVQPFQLEYSAPATLFNDFPLYGLLIFSIVFVLLRLWKDKMSEREDK